MSDNTVQLDQKEMPDIMGMSDDALSQFDISAYLDQSNDATGTEVQPEVQETKPATEAENPEEVSEVSETEGDQPEVEATEEEKPSTTQTTDTQQTDKPVETAPESQTVPDYKAFYETVIGKPIKASGREITLDKPEDVISLIQMGANYHDKMAALKPSRRILKMLEQANLTDESQLGFLIDVHNKNPQAIAKLIQDSKIDLMDFDASQGEGYKPQHQAPSEKEMALTEVLETHINNPEFNSMFTAVSTWDPESQQLIADNPGLLTVFNTAKQTGMFDKVMSELSRERMLGRLAGVSDIQAYSAIEQRIMASTPVAQQNKTTATAPKKPENAANKKAAALPKNTTSTKKQINLESLLSLSDEEFAKIDPTQLS